VVLEKETKIFQSKNARTQYIIVPADVAGDSQYPFKAGERVRITIDPYHRLLIIRPIDGPEIEISHEGISVKEVVKIIKK
jgi:hypothetical protein